MKGRRILALFIGIVILIVFIILKRYYFLGRMNIYEYNNINRYLNYYYPDNKFCINNIEYTCIKTDDNKYVHLYKMELSDGDMDFYAIQCFKSSKRFEGSFIDDDYKTSIRDNYLRSKLKNYPILSKYENDFYDAVINKIPDYVFTVGDNNIDEIKEAISIIVENAIRSNNSIDVWFELHDKSSILLCNGHEIVIYCNENKNENKDIKDLVSEYIDEVIAETQ